MSAMEALSLWSGMGSCSDGRLCGLDARLYPRLRRSGPRTDDASSVSRHTRSLRHERSHFVFECVANYVDLTRGHGFHRLDLLLVHGREDPRLCRGDEGGSGSTDERLGTVCHWRASAARHHPS